MNMNINTKHKKIICAVIAGVIILITGYAVLRSLLMYSGTQVNMKIIATAIESCAEMTTLRSYFEAVADRQDDKWFGRWRKFVIIFTGMVDVGFDMSKARAEIFEQEKRIEITLPHCKVQRVWVNHESNDKGIRVYDQQGGWFSANFTLEEQNELLSRALEDIRAKASIDWDMILRAEDNAANLYKNFLKSFNYEVNVTFTNDEERLSAPPDVRSDRMKGGGAFIVHTK
ncbi:MAG: DUF4230 domain-containing protein [Synergistaceae bacterium]|nr:DUF4230 domain-containing protein [Synergistaceae bacterium]